MKYLISWGILIVCLTLASALTRCFPLPAPPIKGTIVDTAPATMAKVPPSPSFTEEQMILTYLQGAQDGCEVLTWKELENKSMTDWGIEMNHKAAKYLMSVGISNNIPFP
jgi:hypothetical protein